MTEKELVFVLMQMLGFPLEQRFGRAEHLLEARLWLSAIEEPRIRLAPFCAWRPLRPWTFHLASPEKHRRRGG